MESLPAEGLRRYESLFGLAAQRELDIAVKNRDIVAIENVARRYFFTAAGETACVLLTYEYSYRGQPLVASLYARRLLRKPNLEPDVRGYLQFRLAVSEYLVGQNQQADRALRAWRDEYTKAEVKLGGKTVRVFGKDESPTGWLRDIVGVKPLANYTQQMWAGNLAGTRQLQGKLPRTEGLLLSKPHDTELAGLLKALESQARSKRLCRIPTMQPLIVRDLLITRDSKGLFAIDIENGRQRWRAALESVTRGCEQRVWDDISWGAISTNGDLVFAVDDWRRRDTKFWRRQDASRTKGNCLSAYDVQTGKLVWQVGTTSTKTTQALRDGRFLAPPLPIGDRLYCLVEFPDGYDGHEVLMLSTEGKVVGRWVLGIQEDTQRRLVQPRVMGSQPDVSRIAPPVYSDGILLCAAREGQVAAIDLVSGAVLWNVWLDLVAEAGSPAKYRKSRKSKADAPDRWLATAAHIFEDRAVLTPFESDWLYCLDLRSGKLLWKAPRGDGLFVAGAFDGAVIVVGRSSLNALRMTDGRPAWSDASPAFPNGLVACGTGYFSRDRYCLPFASGSVGVFDLRTGRLQTKVLSNNSLSLGNLVPSGESVFSVGLSNIRRLETRREDDATLPDIDVPK